LIARMSFTCTNENTFSFVNAKVQIILKKKWWAYTIQKGTEAPHLLCTLASGPITRGSVMNPFL
jgi:hypothetical protein